MAKQSLVFDDEPLDGVLYGELSKGPTPADCFIPIKEHMRIIREAAQNRDRTILLETLTLIFSEDMPLHMPICDEIIDITETLIPIDPLPELSYDISGITPLLEKIWSLQKREHDYDRRVRIGNRLYRSYEHQGKFDKARDILNTLISLAQERHRRTSEAVYTNNLAFEYLLEEKWQSAMMLFQRAEKIFINEGDSYEVSNARANYLSCLFSVCSASEMAKHENELNELAQELSKDNNWRARKPNVLLSRIRESLGDIDGAVDYMERAINASEGKGLKWTEIDKTRLSELNSIR
jgi:tetratricopeptide (TPR) repeat protein